MTSDRIARDYLRRSRVRRQALDTLMRGEAFADVVRESQEVVELLLKGMLRFVGLDPPRKHDVRRAVMSALDRFPAELRGKAREVAVGASRLARDRSPAFYGDDEAMVPASDLFDAEDARNALAIVDEALALCGRIVGEPRR